MQQKENRKENGNGDSQTDDSQDKKQTKKPSVWEWVTAFVGLALVLGAVGFMFYKAVWGENSPPDVIVQVEAVEQLNNGHLVKFRAVNQGGSTAEGVVIEAELKRGGEKLETSQMTIDFLPVNSVRQGGFFFTNNPQQYDLQVRPLGYQQP